MQIDIITLFPEFVETVKNYGVIGRAVRAGLLEISTINPRDFTDNKARTVDDRPYGGGPGMVMMYEPVHKAINYAFNGLRQRSSGKVIYLSPQGRKLDQQGVHYLAGHSHLVLLCGRYEGVDERIIEDLVDEEWSIGDYVLSGGEIAAMATVDAIGRQIPGVLGHEESVQCDSFENGLLDHPHFTRPEIVGDKKVPDVLLSGDHERIARWRLKESLGRTYERRHELLEKRGLSSREQQLLEEYILEKSANLGDKHE